MRLACLCSAILFVAACTSTTTYTDAAVGDDTLIDADTGIDAAPSGTVHVTAFGRNGAPPDTRVENVEVLVIGVDGTLRDRDQTDANGEATLDVVSGDTVTAIYDLVADQDVRLTTFAGVKPGDDLTFGDWADQSAPTTPVGTMTLTWPAFSGAYALYLVDDCGTQLLATDATSATITQTMACNGPTFSAIVYAITSSFQVLAYGEIHGATFTDLGTANIPAVLPTTSFDIDFTGISSEISSGYDVYVYATVGRNVTVPDYWSYYTYLSPVDGAASGSIAPYLDGVDGAYLYEYYYRNGNYGGQQSVRRLDPGVHALTTPMTPLPWLSDSVLTSVPARTIQWFQIGGAPYDGAHVHFDWSVFMSASSGSGFGLGSGSYIDYDWDVFLPPGATGLVFPELPSDLAAYAPSERSSIDVDVELFESDAVADYDAARALPEWELTCLDCGAPNAATVPVVRWSRTGGGGKGVAAKRQPSRSVRTKAVR